MKNESFFKLNGQKVLKSHKIKFSVYFCILKMSTYQILLRLRHFIKKFKLKMYFNYFYGASTKSYDSDLNFLAVKKVNESPGWCGSVD